MKNKKSVNRVNKKFTAIDLLICLLFLAAVVYMGIRIFQSEKLKDESNVSFDVSFIFSEENKEVFKIGDVVLTSDGKYEVGKITNVSYSDVTEKNFDLSVKEDIISEDIISEDIISEDIVSEDMNEVSKEISENEFSDEYMDTEISKALVTETVIKGYVKVTLTVVGTLEYNNGKYFLNGSSFKIGDEIEITTKDYSSFGKCILISSLNDNAQ